VTRARPTLGGMTPAPFLAAALSVLVTAVPAVASTSAAPVTGGWPLVPEPEVVAAFDPPDHEWSSGHRGVDLAGRVGQRVRAALPGRVTFSGRIAGRGVVVVSHGATRTTYEPVSGSVEPGDQVGEGDHLGGLEWFGSHCFPETCLHWGLLEGDTYLDPLTLVDAGPRPVRLLPLAGPASDVAGSHRSVGPLDPPGLYGLGEPVGRVWAAGPVHTNCLQAGMGRPGQALGWACW